MEKHGLKPWEVGDLTPLEVDRIFVRAKEEKRRADSRRRGR